MTTTKKTKPHCLPKQVISIILLGVTASSLFAVCVSIGLVLLQIRLEQIEQAEKILDRSRLIRNDIVYNLEQLNQAHYLTCTDQTLDFMRRVAFESAFPIEIAFIEDDKIVCTTGKGRLSIPLSFPSQDYISLKQHQVWLNYKAQVPLYNQSEQTMHYIRQGFYQIMLRPELMNFPGELPFPWMLERTEDITKSSTNLVKQINLNNPTQSFKHSFNYRACITFRDSFCTTIYGPISLLMRNYASSWLLATVFVILSAFVCFFYLKTRAYAKNSVSTRVQQGLNQSAYFWLYQPIVDLRSGKIIGCEALARFEDLYGEIGPMTFMPILKRQTLTWKLTELMLQSVHDDLSQLPLSDNFKVSMNLSPVDIDVQKMESIVRWVNNHSFNFQLGFEIVEDEHLSYDDAHRALQVLIDAGHELSIDDFGVGYSNMSHLDQLNCHTVKIDRTFVRDIETSGLKSSLIPHIIKIAQQFNLTVIAEGIETEAQAKLLIDMGVIFGQGWHFGKAMSAEAIGQLIAEQENT